MRGRSVKLLPFFVAHVFFPVHRAELVQRAEDLVRQRHHHVFHFFGQLFNVDMLRGLGALGAERSGRDYGHRASL